jgi:Major Facilitator Superfamily
MSSNISDANLGAAFSSGSIFGNIFWGIIADKYGRRLALLSGLGGTIAAVTLFGFSPTFNIAVGARFLWGFLNGNIGVSKTYIGELLDDSNNPRGMTLYGTIGGTGRFIGPIVGIYLISPAERYHLFVGTLFEDFPLALPSSMVALSCAIVLLFAYFELQETFKLRQKRVNSGMGAISYNRDGKTVRRGTAEYSRISGTDIDTEPDIENDLDGSIGLHGRPMKSIEYGQVFTLNHDFELEKAKAKGGMKSSKGSKKSLALALPLLSLTLRNQETDDCNADDDRTVVTQASTTSTALIEQSLPSHFRFQPNLHTSDEQLNTVGNLNVSVTDYPSTSILSDDCIIGGTLFGIDSQESSLFPYNQDLTRVLGTENGMKVLEPIDVSCVPVDFMSALNTCEKRVGKDSDATGRENDRASHGKWTLDTPSDASKKKDLESHLANTASSQPQSQSPSRRVSFSSLVTVKVIGSSSLGIGQLKHVRPDDSPVRDFEGFKGQGQVRSAYPHMDNTATIGLRNGISAPSALSSSR